MSVRVTGPKRRTRNRALPDQRPWLSAALGLIAIFGGVSIAALGLSSEVWSVAGHAAIPASKFLEDTVDGLILDSLASLASLESASHAKTTTKDNGRYQVKLAFLPAGIDLYEITAVVIDSGTGHQVDRIVTYRNSAPSTSAARAKKEK